MQQVLFFVLISFDTKKSGRVNRVESDFSDF